MIVLTSEYKYTNSTIIGNVSYRCYIRYCYCFISIRDVTTMIKRMHCRISVLIINYFNFLYDTHWMHIIILAIHIIIVSCLRQKRKKTNDCLTYYIIIYYYSGYTICITYSYCNVRFIKNRPKKLK